MSGTIDDLIQRIKDLPVSEVISRYVHTVRKGTQTLAVCPFHDDHSPSLNVNDTRGMWYCFVDRLGGDAIRFVMLYKNLEFRNALEDICGKLGWDYASYVQTKKKDPKFDFGKKVLTNSSKLYRKIAETKEAEAFQHFLKTRNLDEEIAKEYGLGFAPNQSALFDYLSSIPNDESAKALAMAQDLGLIRPSKFGEKSHYDTFRDRVIFPIWDQFGQVIGYTSRATKEDQKPKYMNSIDSFLFNKSNLLYGLHLAKPFIRDKDNVIVVEGNMDQIALYKFGFKNAVATMGVAMGETALTRLLSLTKNILLSMDNDQAGYKASCRINAQFMEHGIMPKYIDLNPHKDPDDYLENEGHVAMQKVIDDAGYFLDTEIENTIPKDIPTISEQKLDILHSVFNILSPLKNSLSATERVSAVAKRLGLQSDSSTIIKNYESFLTNEEQKPYAKPVAQEQEEEILAAPNIEGEAIHVELTRSISLVEARLLQNLVQNPTLLTFDESIELLDFVENPDVKGYILKVKDLMYEIDDSEYHSVLSNLMDQNVYSAELSSVVSAALYKHHEINLNLKDEKVIKKTINDIKNKLQEEQLKEKKAALVELQKKAASTEENNEFLKKLHALEKEMQAFRGKARKRK
jgi:DNA primase